MTVLVTGATGRVGRSLVQQLMQAGVSTRALSRNPAAANDFPAGLDVVGGDLGDPASLTEALQGVSAVYLFSAAHAAHGFAATAAACGVRRVVVVSGLGESNPCTVEAPLEQAGLAWTHLRPTAFAANAVWQFGPMIRAHRLVYGPYPDAPTAPIHETDIAAVAQAALLQDGHAGHRYQLTGPESLTYRQQVATIAGAIGDDIGFIEETPEQARQRMSQTIPEPVVDRLLMVWAAQVGRAATVERTVEEVTGRPARTFAEWTDAHADEFR